MTNTVSKAFAKGLAVFSGKSTFEKITRGKFAMVSSAIDDREVSYIDQWFPGHLGGGQEILETGGKRFTRVYAGGTVDDAKLSSLGITKYDVMACLKKSLLTAQEKTRFDGSFALDDGKWVYRYTPGEKDEITGVITGKEAILYETVPVFIHFFLISFVIE